MDRHAKELQVFGTALDDHIKPLAEKFGLTFTKIDCELFTMVGPNFSLKFYCAGGHGYSFTITVSPTYTRRWNAEDEKGFPWLIEYVGRHNWKHTEHFNLAAFAQSLADLAAILPDYLELLRTVAPSYWESFFTFVADEIARKPEPTWMKWFEKNHRS